MVEKEKVKEAIGRIRNYREGIPPLPESAVKGWNDRPRHYCEFVEGNLFYLLYRISSIREDQFIQSLVQAIREIREFAEHILIHGKLDEAEREHEKAIAEAMIFVQRIMDELICLSAWLPE